jgi:hypothetical protein
MTRESPEKLPAQAPARGGSAADRVGGGAAVHQAGGGAGGAAGTAVSTAAARNPILSIQGRDVLTLLAGTQLVWLVLALGAGLRLATLGMQSIWLDEGVTFWTINRSLPDLFEQLAGGTRPLFFYLAYPFYLIGPQEWLLRLPSALASIASLALFYRLGRELFDRPTALLATAFLALAPLHLWYAQEARFYALVGLVSLSAVYFAVRGLKANRGSAWVLMGLFEGLGLWTESGGIWLILALNTAGLLLVRHLWRTRRLPGWILAQMVAVLVYLPRLERFVSSVQGGSASWIPPATVREVLRVLADFAGGFMLPAWFGVLALLGVGLGLLLGLRRMASEAPRRWQTYAILLAWLVVPISASFVLSQPYFRPELLSFFFGERPSIFLTRNLITILMPLMMLLARSLVLQMRYPQTPLEPLPAPAEVPEAEQEAEDLGDASQPADRPRQTPQAAFWRISAISLAAGILVLYSGGYFGNHLAVRKEDYRSAARWVAAHVQPGDLVLTSPGYVEQPVAYYYFDYYPPRDLSLAAVRDGVVDSEQARQDQSWLAAQFDDIESLVWQHERVWLVTTNNIYQRPDAALTGFLDAHTRLEERYEFTETQVHLFLVPARQVQAP